MSKYGLKLWSNNERYITQAEKLYNEKAYDYVELYIVPGTYDKHIEMWNSLKIPYIIHCTHYMHGFNLADKERFKDNLKMFSEVKAFCDKLNGKHIIIHPGIGDSIENTTEQINILSEKRLLVENMPYVSMFGDDCRGSVYEELKTIVDSCNVGFCLDVAHAITTAFHLGIDSFEYMKKMLSLSPGILHISDGTKQIHGKHLNIGDGEFNFEEIKKIIALSSAEYITLELPKENNWIHSFTEDLKKIKNYE
ncbi:sugar phosphate isomerase/epimerase [bacterium]|nr:sugar phosphate isomerase/epimerase [bacterium]